MAAFVPLELTGVVPLATVADAAVADVIADGLVAGGLPVIEVAGGLDALSVLAPVFPQVRFMSSGGVGQANLADYLGHPAVVAASGSWIASAERIEAGPVSIAAAVSEAVAVAAAAAAASA